MSFPYAAPFPHDTGRQSEGNENGGWVLAPCCLRPARRVPPRTSVLGLEFIHISELRNSPAEEILPYWIKELLKLCQPRTFSPGKRVFKPARMLRYKFRAFSPGGRASRLRPDSPQCKCGGMCNPLRRQCGDSRNLLAVKPAHRKIKRSRGFENPLPRTESPGLPQFKQFFDPIRQNLFRRRISQLRKT